jgi:response regulator RpfG family c-di-GMP phosphodiesterase/DNA-binding CsgD family transcriptional regulator
VPGSSHAAPRLVEVVAALSLATDLGLGQPMEHGLRSCLIATRLAEALDLATADREAIYWVTLLAMAGCTGDSSEMTALFGDDIEYRRGMYDVGPSPMAMPEYLLSRAELAPERMGAVMTAFVADCHNTARFAVRLGLGEDVSAPLQQKFARWDGQGIPPEAVGDRIPVAARMLGLSWRAESQHRLGGVDGARRWLEQHAGATLDPEMVEAALPALPAILEGLEPDCWGPVVACEPPRAPLTGRAYDDALEALGDFADLKSPWFTGHSRAVAELAEAAAWRLGMPAPEVDLVRRAALVHSLGRTGVPNTIWDKPGSLSVGERERMQLYPYLTDRILRHGSLEQLADIASQSQERLDGSGYPRGLGGPAISQGARVLAAAQVYRALREPRPHRPAFDDDVAARHLRDEVRDGRLDADATDAVLTVAGHRPQPLERAAPAGLTAREVDVLRLIARGLTSAQTADELGIAGTTVNTHIEHIYAKTGAANRSMVTLFAMEHGVV